MRQTPSVEQQTLVADNTQQTISSPDQAECQIATAPLVSNLLHAHAPVALGVSGGKDSGAMALATTSYLDHLGHRRPRLLIHRDLGWVEWRESLPMCQKLADVLNLKLVVVRRQAGDLLDRWQVWWRILYNLARFSEEEDRKRAQNIQNAS